MSRLGAQDSQHGVCTGTPHRLPGACRAVADLPLALLVAPGILEGPLDGHPTRIKFPGLPCTRFPASLLFLLLSPLPSTVLGKKISSLCQPGPRQWGGGGMVSGGGGGAGRGALASPAGNEGETHLK